MPQWEPSSPVFSVALAPGAFQRPIGMQRWIDEWPRGQPFVPRSKATDLNDKYSFTAFCSLVVLHSCISQTLLESCRFKRQYTRRKGKRSRTLLADAQFDHG